MFFRAASKISHSEYSILYDVENYWNTFVVIFLNFYIFCDLRVEILIY